MLEFFITLIYGATKKSFIIFYVICDLLSSLVPNDYLCKDTFSFVFQIKIANLSKTFLVSYDLTSLFSNIRLQEIIDIAISLVFNHNPNLKITRKQLKKLFSSLRYRLILVLTVIFIIRWTSHGFSFSSCPC